MSYKPVYHTQNPAIRICFQTSRGWRLQQKAWPNGTREVDCWESESFPMSKDAAKRLMYLRYPITNGKGDIDLDAMAKAMEG